MNRSLCLYVSINYSLLFIFNPFFFVYLNNFLIFYPMYIIHIGDPIKIRIALCRAHLRVTTQGSNWDLWLMVKYFHKYTITHVDLCLSSTLSFTNILLVVLIISKMLQSFNRLFHHYAEMINYMFHSTIH